MLGENWLIFALDPKLKLDTETLLLHSGPKFLRFVVYFYKYSWFRYQTEIVPEKVYAVIWPVLEITSLKSAVTALIQSSPLGYLYELLDYTFPKCPIFLKHFFVTVITILQIFNRGSAAYVQALLLSKAAICKLLPQGARGFICKWGST